jgi:hypothetical protein
MAPGFFAVSQPKKIGRDRTIATAKVMSLYYPLVPPRRTASSLKYWRQWRRWSPPPPAFAACERSSRRRRARLTSSATSSRSSRRRRRRRRRSLRRSEVAPVVCESLGLHLSVRSGRGVDLPSGLLGLGSCVRAGPLGFHVPRKKIMGAWSLLRISRSVCDCIRALDVPGAGCPRGGSTPPPGV